MNDTQNKPLTIFSQGFLLGLVGLSSFYYLLLFAVTQDPTHPFSQFMLFQPWMSLLIIGFGIQMGLFWMMKKGIQFNLQDKKDANFTAGTSTAVSGVAMIACCAHHMIEVLPILGFSAAAIFLSEYQEQLLIFGLVANLIGIMVMLWFITGKAKPKVIFDHLFIKIRRQK